MLITVCRQKPFANGESPYVNYLGGISICKQGVLVCKRGFPVCILGCLFLECIIAKWITHRWAAKLPIFVSSLQVSLPVWGKECLLLLKENLLHEFLWRDFGNNQVWRRLQMFGVYIGTSMTNPQKKQTYPRMHLGIAVCIRGSPYDHHMHTVCLTSIDHP